MSIQLLAFDLDGTLTQHRSALPAAHRTLLLSLRQQYRLLIVGAGTCARIFRQTEGLPADVIGCYGMEFGLYNEAAKALDMVFSHVVPVDREDILSRVAGLRDRFGYTLYSGESVEFHPSGMITVPLLGTAAKLEDKLAFDPDRKKRRAIYDDVCALFPDYNVIAGGSSSFDLSPQPYNKAAALHDYCQRYAIPSDALLYFGDDAGRGGGDESVFLDPAFRMIVVPDYRLFPEKLRENLPAAAEDSLKTANT
ncbi:MAG: HAD hydrolase family protein [Lachnospiraceae bacterium]|nr:HAD hydrolase family protein [Lachnospiraceae bacterium]